MNLCSLEKRKCKDQLALTFQQLKGYQEDTAKLFALVQQHTRNDHSFISKTSFTYLSPQAFFLFVLPKE